jgi:SAM-dependent methyltransferase
LLELVQSLGAERTTSVIDIGGGASLLADRLVSAGFVDVSVLDISDTALQIGRARLGDAAPVTWLCEDLFLWRPTRRYGLWHDRAVFHFLTDRNDRDLYLRLLGTTIEPDGAVVIGTFAADGPERCSGLPVARYSPEALTELLSAGFRVAATGRELHSTPGGVVQPFTWIAAIASSRGQGLRAPVG